MAVSRFSFFRQKGDKVSGKEREKIIYLLVVVAFFVSSDFKIVLG